MPSNEIKAAVKRKAKEKVVKVAKQKISSRGSGTGTASGGGRGSGKKSGKKGNKSIMMYIVIAVLVIGVGAAAWHFGLLDGLLQGETETNIETPEVVAVNGTAELHFIDVGQADATLIITDGGTMLIDAGNRRSGPRVVEYLQELGITELTYAVGTHPHEDHIGGMDLVLNAFSVNTLLIPAVSHTTRTYERMIDAALNNDVNTVVPDVGSVINLGGAVFTIIHPNSDRYNNLNDWSISKRMVFGNVSMVTTGDAEHPAEREMLEAGHYLNSDILRLGHHGSRTSTGQEFFDAVSPSIAIIQVAEDNKYGHPHPEVMEILENAGIRVYRNDHHGDIVLTTDGTNIDIRTAR